jgi:integrase
MVSRENDPYYDYSIAPVPPKDIDCLTAKQMYRMMTYEPKQVGLQMARDIAMMSFYLCGANLLDLYDMGMPKNGECVFVRHKIEHRYQRDIHIRIEPELAALVDRWKGDGMLLTFKATYLNYDGFRHKIAHRLRELSMDLGFDLNMAKVRRTWATIAASLDVPDRVIDKSMGHVDSTIKDRHYEQYDWNRTAEANRKVIDYVRSVTKIV